MFRARFGAHRRLAHGSCEPRSTITVTVATLSVPVTVIITHCFRPDLFCACSSCPSLFTAADGSMCGGVALSPARAVVWAHGRRAIRSSIRACMAEACAIVAEPVFRAAVGTRTCVDGTVVSLVPRDTRTGGCLAYDRAETVVGTGVGACGEGAVGSLVQSVALAAVCSTSSVSTAHLSVGPGAGRRRLESVCGVNLCTVGACVACRTDTTVLNAESMRSTAVMAELEGAVTTKRAMRTRFPLYPL